MPLVCCAVERVKRQRVKERGDVKKATGYSWAIFVDLIEKEVVTHADTPDRIDAFHFRSLVRAAVIYFTLCRFDDFKRLTDKEVTDVGSYIKLVFTHSKNDQFGENSISVIPERPESPACLVQLIQLYFQRFGLRFGGSGKLLNFRLRKERGSHSALTQYSLCQSNGTKWTRQLMAKHGYDPTSFTEKSNKARAVDDRSSGHGGAGAVLHGFRTLALHYRALSIQFRLSAASRFPRF
jgi:hypothetical protein